MSDCKWTCPSIRMQAYYEWRSVLYLCSPTLTSLEALKASSSISPNGWSIHEEVICIGTERQDSDVLKGSNIYLWAHFWHFASFHEDPHEQQAPFPSSWEVLSNSCGSVGHCLWWVLSDFVCLGTSYFTCTCQLLDNTHFIEGRLWTRHSSRWWASAVSTPGCGTTAVSVLIATLLTKAELCVEASKFLMNLSDY